MSWQLYKFYDAKRESSDAGATGSEIADKNLFGGGFPFLWLSNSDFGNWPHGYSIGETYPDMFGFPNVSPYSDSEFTGTIFRINASGILRGPTNDTGSNWLVSPFVVPFYNTRCDYSQPDFLLFSVPLPTPQDVPFHFFGTPPGLDECSAYITRYRGRAWRVTFVWSGTSNITLLRIYALSIWEKSFSVSPVDSPCGTYIHITSINTESPGQDTISGVTVDTIP